MLDHHRTQRPTVRDERIAAVPPHARTEPRSEIRSLRNDVKPAELPATNAFTARPPRARGLGDEKRVVCAIRIGIEAAKRGSEKRARSG